MKESSVYEVKDEGEFEEIITCFTNEEALSRFKDREVRKEFVKKQIEFGHVFVQRLEGNPVGLLCFYCNDMLSRVAYVTAFALKEELGIYKGITMQRLAKKLIGLGRVNKMETVRLEVANTNSRARRLYEHLGFEYIGGNDRDSSYMEMPLDKFEAVFWPGMRGAENAV